MAKVYTIGENSQKFLDALDALQIAESKFFDALTDTYGEKTANELYQEHVEQWDAVERGIMDFLRILFTQEMGTDAPRVTL